MDISHLVITAIHTTFCGSHLGLWAWKLLGEIREAESSRYAGGQGSEEELVSPYQGNCCAKASKTSLGYFY